MFSNKIYEKVKVKKYLLLFDFVSFFVFLSLFSIFFFCLLLCQAIFRGLVSFLSFFVFKESTLQYLKKKLSSNNSFYQKKLISTISNSKSPPWNLNKFRSEFFLANVSRIMCWIFFSFDYELMVNYKNTRLLR